MTSLAVGTARGDLNASTANLAGSLASGLAVMMAIIGHYSFFKPNFLLIHRLWNYGDYAKTMRFEKWDNVGATKIMLKQIRNSLLKTTKIMLKQLRNSLLKTTTIML